MMKVLSLLVLLFAQAHSQTLALLSGDPVAVNNQYSVDVTLSQCGPEPTQSDFVFSGATVSNFECSGSDQSYTCSFGVSAPGSSFTVRHTLSNEISVEIQQSVQGVFSSAVVSEEGTVVITYDCGVPCAMGPGSFAVSADEDGNDSIKIWAISHSEGSTFEIVVENSGLSTVYATAGADAVIDPTNMGTNSETTTELDLSGSTTRAVGIQTPACEYSDWGEWSGCDEKVECDTFNAESFTIASGFETRERTILSGNCNGNLEQTRSCPGAVSALCEGEVTYPRPGEHKSVHGLPHEVFRHFTEVCRR